MFFEWNKLNASNENYVSTIIIIGNLIFLANTPTPVLITDHLEWNLTVSCLHGLTERKLLMQFTARGECTLTARKTKSTHYWTYRESVAYKWHHSSIFLKKPWFIFCPFSNLYKIAKLLKTLWKNQNVLVSL